MRDTECHAGRYVIVFFQVHFLFHISDKSVMSDESESRVMDYSVSID